MTNQLNNQYLNTIPTVSLLICTSKKNSACKNKKDVDSWIASVFGEYRMFRLSISVFIWEYSSLSLKTHCPYCDPCDSFKTIPLPTNILPTSRNELENIVQLNEQLNPYPHTVRIVLIYNLADPKYLRKVSREWYDNLRTKPAVLKYIRDYSVESDMMLLYTSADKHLTSLLFPDSSNATFSFFYDKFRYRWKNVIVGACSHKRAINSHPEFRPVIMRYHSKSRNLFQDSRLTFYNDEFRFVSCHKEQIHWTNQFLELISPFDVCTWLLILTTCLIVSWVVKLSNNSDATLFDTTFFMCWSILDQSNRVFNAYRETAKPSFYMCIFFVPLAWLYLSTLYKGDNVTRLTADPPLIQFDTFKMLEEHQFKIYSRRFHLKYNQYMNIRGLRKVHEKYGSVATHEALPVVSELWHLLMTSLRFFGLQFSLNYLKDEISPQMWNYINNSAMLPDHGQGSLESVTTILDIHMNNCTKSAMIVRMPLAIQLHETLKRMGKPSFFGKDIILETYYAYEFIGTFPTKYTVRAGYIFDAGIIEWWEKLYDYSLVLKTNVHYHKLILKTHATSEVVRSKTAVVVLTLIPAVGLLFSAFVFIWAETNFWKVLYIIVVLFLQNVLKIILMPFQYIRKFALKYM